MKKTTQELIDLMRNSKNYRDYMDENRGEISQSFMKVDRALSALLNERKVKKSEVIARSGIEVHYAYQIFSGAKIPGRDKVIMLCLGFGLSAEETQQFLKITGYPQLYGRVERDNAILFGLSTQLSVIDLNGMLYDLNLEILV